MSKRSIDCDTFDLQANLITSTAIRSATVNVTGGLTLPNGITGSAWTIVDSEPPIIATVDTAGARVVVGGVVIRAYRLANLVTLMIRPVTGSLRTPNACDATGTIDLPAGTLSARYVPSGTAYAACQVVSNNVLVNGIMAINTDGSVNVGVASNAGTVGNFTATQLIAWSTGATFVFAGN